MDDYDRRASARYARLFQSMSLDQAKQVLGFPPGAMPSPPEVAKAFKTKSLENHPDRGGKHEVQVDLNVAKDILDGKRREDRHPPISWEVQKAAPPKRDPAAERREQEAKNRRDAIQRVADETLKVMEAVERAAQGADIFRGRLHIPSFLSNEYTAVLDKMIDHAETLPPERAKTPDMVKAVNQIHVLMGMAVRMGKKASSLQKQHGELWTSLLGMESHPLTIQPIEKVYQDIKVFAQTWAKFTIESRNLMSIIVTSELVPLEWSEDYHHSHQVILSFENDFSHFADHGLTALQSVLKLAVQAVEGIAFGFGIKESKPWSKWSIPVDFQRVSDAIRATAN